MTISAISNFFNFGKTSAPSLSESQIKTSLQSNLAGNNPLVLNFGKNVAQDVLLLKALNQLEKSDDGGIWARTTLILTDLGQRIACCEKGPLLAIQEYNKGKLADVMQDGRMDEDKLLAMNGLELHFFLNMATNPDLSLNDRARMTVALKEIVEQSEESQDKQLTLASLEAAPSHVINFLNKQAFQYLRTSNKPDTELKPEPELQQQKDTLSEQMSQVSPGTVVKIESDGTISQSEVKSNDAQRLQQEKKKPSGFFGKLLNLFSGNSQKSDNGKTIEATPRNNLATRFANWLQEFTTSSTKPR